MERTRGEAEAQALADEVQMSFFFSWAEFLGWRFFVNQCAGRHTASANGFRVERGTGVRDHDGRSIGSLGGRHPERRIGWQEQRASGRGAAPDVWRVFKARRVREDEDEAAREFLARNRACGDEHAVATGKSSAQECEVGS